MAGGIFALVGEMVADLAGQALFDGVGVRLFSPDRPKGLSPSALPPPERIDAESVIAAYREILGVQADLGESLYHGSLTPIVALAGSVDFALVSATGGALMTVFGDFGIWSVGFAWILLAGLGHLLARSGDPRPAPERPKTSVPLGIFTGMILRARLRHRYERVAREPFSSDDPLVIGPVAHLWSREPLAWAEHLSGSGSGLLSESTGASGIVRLGGDPIASRDLEARTQTSRMELRRTTEAMRAFLAAPESIDRSPLRAAQTTFAALRTEILIAERLVVETAALRRAFPLGTGSLEGPIRLNERA